MKYIDFYDIFNIFSALLAGYFLHAYVSNPHLLVTKTSPPVSVDSLFIASIPDANQLFFGTIFHCFLYFILDPKNFLWVLFYFKIIFSSPAHGAV